jgi:hypothetical protein
LNKVLHQLDDRLQAERFTGVIQVVYNQGGIRGIKQVREEIVDLKVLTVGWVQRST